MHNAVTVGLIRIYRIILCYPIKIAHVFEINFHGAANKNESHIDGNGNYRPNVRCRSERHCILRFRRLQIASWFAEIHSVLM